jgi:hypothetical protein
VSPKKKHEQKQPKAKAASQELWLAPDLRRVMGGEEFEKTYAPLKNEPGTGPNRLLELADIALSRRLVQRTRRRRTDPQ